MVRHSEVCKYSLCEVVECACVSEAEMRGRGCVRDGDWGCVCDVCDHHVLVHELSAAVVRLQ